MKKLCLNVKIVTNCQNCDLNQDIKKKVQSSLHNHSRPRPLVSQREPRRRTDGQSTEQTVSWLRSTRLLLADCGQIRPQPDYATAIHFPAAVCHMIDLSI